MSVSGDFPGGPVAKTPRSHAGGPGSIPGQGTRSLMPQLKSSHATTKIQHAAMKIPCATTKTPHSQINK